jgi:lysozyme
MKYKLKTPVVLDVSRWQGEVDWPNVLPHPIIVICKASEGTSYSDETFPKNWEGLKALKVRRGAYHYFHPEMDVSKQFENYQKAVAQAGGFVTGDLPPVLDIEGLDSAPFKVRLAAAAGIKNWLDKAQAFFGRVPMIYTNKDQWSFVTDEKGAAPAWAANYPLWLAWYPKEPDGFNTPSAGVIPNFWKQWAIWQYAKNGKIRGLNAQVDLNIVADWFLKELDQPDYQPDETPKSPALHTYQGTVVAPRGVNVRLKPDVNSRLVGALVAGTVVRGKSIKVISPREAWLEIKDPLSGWCAIVYDGTTLISVNAS